VSKYFLDLGAFTGDTIAAAMRWYPDRDHYIGFEPLPEHFEKLVAAYGTDSRVELINSAADVRNGEATLFRGNSSGQSGGSLCQKDNCLTEGALTVRTLRLADFLRERLTARDHVVLKMDIEGKEYEVLADLIESGAFALVDVLYCVWLYDRIGVDKRDHDRLVERLNGLGFGLTGNNSLDEFHFVAKDWAAMGRVRYAFTRGWPKTKLRLRYRFPSLWNAVRTLRGRSSAA
jgi:FkbM family methyltransferase